MAQESYIARTLVPYTTYIARTLCHTQPILLGLLCHKLCMAQESQQCAIMAQESYIARTLVPYTICAGLFCKRPFVGFFCRRPSNLGSVLGVASCALWHKSPSNIGPHSQI